VPGGYADYRFDLSVVRFPKEQTSLSGNAILSSPTRPNAEMDCFHLPFVEPHAQARSNLAGPAHGKAADSPSLRDTPNSWGVY
jgi:hypothetical protein